MAVRWRRAMRLLRAPAGARVLDLGCGFGFGSGMLGRAYACVGIDRSPSFIASAARAVRGVQFVRAGAEALPFADASFDAVVCLEVIEHLADERLAIDEMRRVLRAQGELVLSVPNAGALQEWDSLNVYQRRTGRQLAFPLGETPSGSRWHRHYGLAQLAGLLEGFRIDEVRRSGTGLAEIVNTGLLALCERRLRWFERLQWVYFALAIADDGLPGGRRAYTLMIHARKLA